MGEEYLEMIRRREEILRKNPLLKKEHEECMAFFLRLSEEGQIAREEGADPSTEKKGQEK